MSVQNVINITEANLHQTLEQSVTAPVLFYFWSARPALRAADAGSGRIIAQHNGQFAAGESGLRC